MKKLLTVLLLCLLTSAVFAASPQPMTLNQATAYAQSHWTVEQIAPLIQDLSTVLYRKPEITGPRMIGVLQKNGTLDVYWDTPDLELTWPDPNDSSKTLLKLTVPLPTLHQPNFYKAPSSIKGYMISGAVGVVLGALAYAILVK